MGIMIGMLTGYSVMKALTSKKHKKHMTFGGAVEVVHNIPGRIRMRTEKLKNKAIGEALYAQLAKIDGINSIAVDGITGSVLVTYTPEQIDSELLIGALYKLLGYADAMNELTQSKVYKEIQHVNTSVNYALLDKTHGYLDAKTLLPLTFVGMATYQLLRTRALTMPSSVTLLWWAYNSLDLGGPTKCQ